MILRLYIKHNINYKGGILMSMGNIMEVVCPQILVGTVSVHREQKLNLKASNLSRGNLGREIGRS